MVGNPIVVKMIESTIDKTIREIKTNPAKGVKSIVDLAKRFASSPVQKDLAITLETMLGNPTSPYHTIIPSLINHVNSKTLKTYIMNMAHNSWSHGGKKIQQYKRVYNHNIPWTITFDFRPETDSKLSTNTLLDIVEQGKKLGIYTYLIYTNDFNDFAPIIKRNPDVAFMLFLPPEIITTKNIYQLASYSNTFFSVLYQPGINTRAFKLTTNLLFENQLLFGSYSYYNNDNIDYILKNRWIDEVALSSSPFALLIQSPNISQTNASLIHDYIYNSKLNQQHHLLLVDLYEDIAKIGNQLSAIPRIITITSSGSIIPTLSDEADNRNILNTPLLKFFTT